MDVPIGAASCAQRLAEVTSSSGQLWYLRSRNDGHPDPRLRGRVAGDHLFVARFEPTLGRNTFGAWLDADIAACTSNTCRVEGWIRLDPRSVAAVACVAVGAALVAAGSTAAGIAELRSGRLGGIALLLVLPIFVGLAAVVHRSGLRRYGREAAELTTTITHLLSATGASGRS